MILGLDVSTSITGATLLDKDGNIVFNEAWDTRKFKDLFDKAEFVKERIKHVYGNYGHYGGSVDNICIRHIYIEQSLQSFRSGFSSAKTLSTLSRFNGIVSWICFNYFRIKPEYIAATTARKLCGIKVPRGNKAKDIVLQHVINTESSFVLEYTKHGNPKPDTFDRADSLIIAKAGHQIANNEKY
jgi:hypothetical protein